MCGRATYELTWEEIVALYDLTLDARPAWNFEPNYNLCPTQKIGAITAQDGARKYEIMRWGLVPRWWSKPLKELRLATFNARAETVESKPFFRQAFKRNRCIIPVSGYYEWHYPEPDNKKAKPQPYYFTPSDGSPILSVGGFWEEWTDKETNQPLKSCTMIITEPNQFVAEVHDRMPVLLRPDQFSAWLSGEAGKEMLVPAPEDMLRKWPVSQRVNSSRADGHDRTLIESVEPLTARG